MLRMSYRSPVPVVSFNPHKAERLLLELAEKL